MSWSHRHKGSHCGSFQQRGFNSEASQPAFELVLAESFPRVCEREARPWESDVNVCVCTSESTKKAFCFPGIKEVTNLVLILLLLSNFA